MSYFKKYNELLKTFESTPKEIKDFSIYNLLKEFGELTSDLKSLIIPALLIESTSQVIADEDFERDYEIFRKRFKEICKFTITFLKMQEKLKSKKYNSLIDAGYVKSLDKEIKTTVELFEEQASNYVKKSEQFVHKIQNAYFAYIQLAEVINLTIVEYNENYEIKLPVLKNIPNIVKVDPPVNLDTYFQSWLQKLNNIWN